MNNFNIVSLIQRKTSSQMVCVGYVSRFLVIFPCFVSEYDLRIHSHFFIFLFPYKVTAIYKKIATPLKLFFKIPWWFARNLWVFSKLSFNCRLSKSLNLYYIDTYKYDWNSTHLNVFIS